MPVNKDSTTPVKDLWEQYFEGSGLKHLNLPPNNIEILHDAFFNGAFSLVAAINNKETTPRIAVDEANQWVAEIVSQGKLRTVADA